MNAIPRALLSQFRRKLRPNKVLMLLGPRRSGKTAFVKDYLKTVDPTKTLVLNGEDLMDASLLQERSVVNYSRLLADKDLLVIDEAQHIPEMGLILKLIVDSIEGIQATKHTFHISLGANGIFKNRRFQNYY
jgi:predicted AAA+ superfamily ATPase